MSVALETLTTNHAPPRSTAPAAVLFLFFFCSGLCGLVYQTVWLRLALASFGVITPVVSVVLAVFMLGLGLGSWLGGKYIDAAKQRLHLSALTMYGLSELVITAGALSVPSLFSIGQQALLRIGEADSTLYLSASALVIALAIMPFTIAMGTTFPFIMSFLREIGQSEKRSFSFLYIANVAGAVLGALLTAFVFIEIWGFHGTLSAAAMVNLLVGVCAIAIGRKSVLQANAGPQVSDRSSNTITVPLHFLILFVTGFTSMAMEVVWTRQFTPVLGNVVYAFASLLTAYLLSSCAGSLWYRFDAWRGKAQSVRSIMALSASAGLLPIVLTDPRLHSAVSPLLSIAPLCALLGYLTPMLIDELSEGNPSVAGRAYAFNIAGCIIGPLVAGYFMLPEVSTRIALILLAIPYLVLAIAAMEKSSPPGLPSKDKGGTWSFVWQAGLAVALFVGALFCRCWEEPLGTDKVVVKRDYAAAVTATGVGRDKTLTVNGISMTGLTTICKYMAHLPLAFKGGQSRDALTICFGMGTSFKSLASWGLNVTAVELIPSVPKVFGYFHSDADVVLGNPKAKIVIDDGRRFLKRTQQKYDVIVIDPPPPPQAAGSSLLYSEEFYREIRAHLKPGGILQQWYPYDLVGLGAAANSLNRSFPYVRVYDSLGEWGWHFLASDRPIDNPNADELLARMPQSAKNDLTEWDAKNDPAQLRHNVTEILKTGKPGYRLITNARITDDRPFNEYYWWRDNKHSFEFWRKR